MRDSVDHGRERVVPRGPSQLGEPALGGGVQQDRVVGREQRQTGGLLVAGEVGRTGGRERRAADSLGEQTGEGDDERGVVGGEAPVVGSAQQWFNFPALRRHNNGDCLDARQRRIRLRCGMYSTGTFFVALSQRDKVDMEKKQILLDRCWYRAGDGMYEWGGRLELIRPLPPLGTTEPARP